MLSLLVACASSESSSPLQLGTLADGTPCRASEGTININFRDASVAHSNLGGHGPDFWAPPTVLLTNVGRVDGRRIDLSISNLTEYTMLYVADTWNAASFNGILAESNGTFGRLGVRAPARGVADTTSVALRFTFLDAGADGLDAATAQPIRLARTFMYVQCRDRRRVVTGGVVCRV
jgi:hypothetical protein